MVSGSSESPSGLPVEAAIILEKPFSEAQLLASLRPLLTQKAAWVSCSATGQRVRPSLGKTCPGPPCFVTSVSRGHFAQSSFTAKVYRISCNGFRKGRSTGSPSILLTSG